MAEKKRVAVYGSTGSIGTQTLDVMRNLEGVEAAVLCSNRNVDLLFEQIKEFKPRRAAVIDDYSAQRLAKLVRNEGLDTAVFSGVDGAIEACTQKEVDIVVSAAVGIAGLKPTIKFIESGKTIALANKETLVTGGELVMKLASDHGVKILPVDSEHSAIFQSLQGNSDNPIEKIILTASGGPFRGKKRKDLEKVTLEAALNHPNWKMGSKITIDSATLMNKGLEIIEAKWLFGVTLDQIEVVIHPQSVVHSAVQYADGSVIAQMGTPDMRTPIQYALTYPKRAKNSFQRLDLVGKNLTFETPDYGTFKCLTCAIEAAKKGGNYPAVVNGANETAVALFLKRKINFLDIPDLVESAFKSFVDCDCTTLDSIFAADSWARVHVNSKVASESICYAGD